MEENQNLKIALLRSVLNILNLLHKVVLNFLGPVTSIMGKAKVKN